MSKRVIFISLLLCAFGLWCGWDMIQWFLKGRVVINTSVFFFPAGCGLLLGHRHARSSASWTFSLFYVGLVLAVVGTALDFGGPIAPPAPGSGVRVTTITSIPGMLPQLGMSVLLVAELIALALAMLVHWQLYTPPFDEHLTA